MKGSEILFDAHSSISAHCVRTDRTAESAGEESPMQLKERLRRLRQSSRLDQDKRLGVPLGILWGLAISVVLWAIIRWLLGVAITALAGI